MKKLTVPVVIATLALAAQGVQSLTSTNTEAHTPLVALGVAILASGVFLLRRPVIVPNP